MDGRTVLCIKEVMAEMRVSRRTVLNWMQKNKVEFVFTPGGQPRIFADSLYKRKRGPSVIDGATVQGTES